MLKRIRRLGTRQLDAHGRLGTRRRDARGDGHRHHPKKHEFFAGKDLSVDKFSMSARIAFERSEPACENLRFFDQIHACTVTDRRSRRTQSRSSPARRFSHRRPSGTCRRLWAKATTVDRTCAWGSRSEVLPVELHAPRRRLVSRRSRIWSILRRRPELSAVW